MEEEIRSFDEEKRANAGHYLDRPGIRELIALRWSEINVSQVETALKPMRSGNPDELEIWEAAQREKRTLVLAEASGGDSMRELQMQLYEECFGVNATPGREESFHDSVAPTPGGMISHGYPKAISNGYDLERAAELNFSGEDARTAVQSLSEMDEREGLAGVLTEIMYPLQVGPGSYMSERQRQISRERLLGNRLKPKDEESTWALRLVEMVKEDPAFLRSVEDPELLKLAGIREGVKVGLARYWSLIWGKFSRGLLEVNEYGNATYKDPQDPEVIAETGKLLTVRVHPETQILFKYLSPSGYLNDREKT
jgi:hypothetical protein